MPYLANMSVFWLAAWLLAVPLVHVHPEADHRHGLPGHVHGGTFHTVFSPELRCVTGAAGDDGRPAHRRGGEGPTGPLPREPHYGDHPAIAFSLLTTKADGIDGQAAGPDDPVDPAGRERACQPRLAEAPADGPPLSPQRIPQGSDSPRAPPILASA